MNGCLNNKIIFAPPCFEISWCTCLSLQLNRLSYVFKIDTEILHISKHGKIQYQENVVRKTNYFIRGHVSRAQHQRCTAHSS